MKKATLFSALILPVVFGFRCSDETSLTVKRNYHANSSDMVENIRTTGDISSAEWMKYLPDDMKITDINIPGAHDAATAHTSATAIIDLYTNCQSLYIGSQSYTTKRAFKQDVTTTEEGLLEHGVRYLDIRYNLQDTKLADDGSLAYNSARLKLAHGTFTCNYKTVDNGILPDHYETTDNDKLMAWCKDFLTAHPSETIILDLQDEEDKETQEYATKFFSELAKNPNPAYPEVYDATSKGVPTLGEVRGKIVLLSNFGYNDSSLRKNVGFGNAYTYGDEEAKNYSLAYRDTDRMVSVYMNNAYNFSWSLSNFLSSTVNQKIEWVNNGLLKAEEYKRQENENGYDAFMLLYTNANSIGNGNLIDTIKDYAKKVNPAVAETLKEQGKKFYGIVAMDFMDDKDIQENMSAKIWQTNFDLEYSF